MGDLQGIVQQIVGRIDRGTIGSQTSPESSGYKCEKCRDTGWIEFTDENGNRFANKCSCRLAREAEERMRVSGLADSIRQQTFEAFKVNNPVQNQIKDTAKRYLDDLLTSWGKPRMPWLYIGGNPGSGKTHICTAVCGELLRHNIGVKYMQWLSEVRKLKSCAFDENFEDEVCEYVGPPVLYIDDLLKQKYTDDPVFTEADIKVAFTILNARYLLNRPTIISSEWDLTDQLLNADEGVFSRVYERCRGYAINIRRTRENDYRLMGGVK